MGSESVSHDLQPFMSCDRYKEPVWDTLRCAGAVKPLPAPKS